MNDLKEPKQEKKNELSTPLDVSKSSENKERYSIRKNPITKMYQVVHNKSGRVIDEQSNKNAAEQTKQMLEVKTDSGQAYEIIHNTPFYAGKLKNEKWAIGCGNHRTSMEFETAEEAVKFVKKHAEVLELIGMYTEEAIQYALKIENQKHNL